MTKSDEEIVKDFYQYVNMTVPELEEWLETKESKESGTGVGHDSGERIVEILKTYGDKPKSVDEYDEEDLKHMRKVCAYCSRHLKQESHLVDEKDPEDLEKTKSYRSLKNWGLDELKNK